MPAHIVVRVAAVTDPAGMARYREAVPPIVAAAGGRYLIRGGNREWLEGEGALPGVAVVEFPDRKSALDWYRSPAYAPWLALRKAASQGEAILIDA